MGIASAEAVLIHYGTKRHSGRYPYGSGENPYQHEANFLNTADELKSKGLSEKEIADYFDMSVRDYRAEKSLARMRVREQERTQVLSMLAEGKSYAQIAREMGKPESTIRSYAKSGGNRNQQITKATSDILKKKVDESGYLDVGKGVAESMGITEARLETALKDLRNQGYEVETIYVKQAWGNKQYTTVKVLAKKGATRRDILENRDKIALVNERFTDQNSTEVEQLHPVESVSSDKVEVRFAEDGGGSKDGVIEIRRGAENLDLGEARYAQVRIGVDDKYYLKGMAVYSDDLPPGVDIRFNTSKKRSSVGSKLDALKPMEGPVSDPQAAFKASVKKQRGALNILTEEGDWSLWSKTLSSQMLSKQPVQLAKRQLKAAELAQKVEHDEIANLNNPALKSYLLDQFADKCETAAVNLKAAAMPRQAYHVILPLDTIKSNEIYAPKYRNGESVVLIRHPHGGTFEIPELKVNNSNKEAKRLFENSKDAVGIHPDVAARLSGADFDGDTVLVIPNNDRSVKNSPAIKELQEFDPKYVYAKTERTKTIDSDGNTISERHKQREMGVVSNLITDMTLRKAPIEDVTRAVKYSMVIIDARKHKLDYSQARRDFGVNELVKKYQVEPSGSGGASTLISRASSNPTVPEVKRAYKANEKGEKPYVPTGRTYTDRSGRVQKYTTRDVPAMRLTSDARTLSSGTVMEETYADYANSMKELARQSRREAMSTKQVEYSPEAARKYADQLKSLDAKIKRAKSHAPLERKAQLLADSAVQMMKQENAMTKEQESKARARALSRARAKLGGTKATFAITDEEWDAIQSGAVSKTKQLEIFRHTDQDELRKRATPRSQRGLTPAQLSLAKARLAMGYTLAEVADSLGVSASTLSKSI